MHELTDEEVVERLRVACAGKGVRLTQQRLDVYREVVRGGAHPDAESVYTALRGRLPSLSLDTVYRALWLLADLGLITTLGLPRARLRFDANTTPHHHFVCIRCGEAQDFYSSEFDALQAPKAVAQFGKIERAHVEFRGICSRCALEARIT